MNRLLAISIIDSISKGLASDDLIKNFAIQLMCSDDLVKQFIDNLKTTKQFEKRFRLLKEANNKNKMDLSENPVF